MANIRVLAQTIGGIALSVSVASVTASVAVQEYRIKQVAQPATIPIISNIFPVPLTPMLPESVFALENAITLSNFSRQFVDFSSPEETIELSVVYNREFSDNLDTLEAAKYTLDKFVVDEVSSSELASKSASIVLFSDAVSVELALISLGKVFADDTQTVETTVKNTNKIVFDQISTTEVIVTTIDYNRVFTDSIHVIEFLTAIGKDKIVEVTTTTDFEINFSTNKTVFDVVNSVEFAKFNSAKLLTDSAEPTETIATTVGYNRVFADNAEPTEVAITNINVISVDRADFNRLQFNIGMVNGPISEIKSTDGVVNAVEINGLMFNESTQEL